MTAPWLTAIGLVLVIEGLAYALFPGLLQRMIAAILTQSREQMRMMGVCSLAAGVFVVWLAKGL